MEQRPPRISRVSGVMAWDFSKRRRRRKEKGESKHRDDDEDEITIGACEARKSRIEVQSLHIKKHDTAKLRACPRFLPQFRRTSLHSLQRYEMNHAEYHLHLANMFTRLNYNHFYSMD